jgi:CHAD domain-containing protein
MRSVEARRSAARQAMRGAIAQADPAAWLRAFHRWLAQRAWRSEPAQQAAPQEPLQPWAARALQAGHKKLVRSARDFARQSPQQRHALRLWVKRQRYATEFFETLPGAAPHAKYRGCLHELQSSLGRANDAHIARVLLGHALEGDPGVGAAGQAHGASRFVLGWLARQAVEPADPGVLKALKFIRKSRPAW